MKGITLVGGEGYIGANLQHRLSQAGVRYKVVDFGIYRDGPIEPLQAVENFPIDAFAGRTVVWLAGFHREPASLGRFSRERWEHAYRRLMVEFPTSICRAGSPARMIYISSMRALTEADSLYAETKRQAELSLQPLGAHIVRPGTVWGGWHPARPFRPNTAVNSALVHGKFLGSTWKAFTCHMGRLTTALVHAALTEDNLSATAQNVVDRHSPLTARELRALLKGKILPGYEAFERELEDLQAHSVQGCLDECRCRETGEPLGEHVAQERMRQYYGLSDEVEEGVK